MIVKHHFEHEGNKYSCYLFQDNYRYTVTTPTGTEYREIYMTSGLGADLIDSLEALEALLIEDRFLFPYTEVQLKAKCIRCSKPYGAPRKIFNLAPICNRCYEVMYYQGNSSHGSGDTWYQINEDGSKGQVIKENSNA